MIIDDLQILISADGSGVQQVLNKTLQTVIGTVNQINGQEIDWTSIFSSSVSPAMIAGVASQFAVAIAAAGIGSAVQSGVQANTAATNLNNISTPAVEAFNNSLGNANGQIYQLAETAGLSLGDATTTFNAFSKAGLDSAAATQATADAAGIARDTGDSLSSVVSELSDLFQNWGVTTTPAVTDALTGLVNASQNGKFSFDELVSAMSDQGPLLSSKTNISDTAISLAALSTQTDLSKQNIVSTFGSIATAVANPLNTMNLIVTNTSKDITSGPNGLITAFSAIENYVKSSGQTTSQLILGQMGVSSGAISQFGTDATGAMNNAVTAFQTIIANLTPLVKDLSDHESVMAKVNADWSTFRDIVAQVVLPKLGDFVTAASQGIGQILTDLKKGDIGQALADTLEDGWKIASATFKLSSSVLSGIGDPIAAAITKSIQGAAGVGETGSSITVGQGAAAIAKGFTLGPLESLADPLVNLFTSALKQATTNVSSALNGVGTVYGSGGGSTVNLNFSASSPLTSAQITNLIQGAGYKGFNGY